jgi:hypothetical protein
VFLKRINARPGNDTLDMNNGDKGGNMLDPNQEIKQSVDEIRVNKNSSH